MEIRGGNGYVEDWVNARLVRDAHVGVLWEGTSNIVALDVVARAVAKSNAHQALGKALQQKLAEATEVPSDFRDPLGAMIVRAVSFASEAAANNETHARLAASALYNVTSAVLMAWEAAKTGNGKRLLLARMVMDHRLRPHDPMAPDDGARENAAIELLLDEKPLALSSVARIV